MLFTRHPESHVGHGEAMIRPKASDKFDFEGELAFVVSKSGRHIAKEEALDYVAGYSCYNDGPIRDFQAHTHQFTPGKNFWRSGSFGPWLVTTDEIPDPSALTLETRPQRPGHAARADVGPALRRPLPNQLPLHGCTAASWRCRIDRHHRGRGQGPQAASVYESRRQDRG